MNTTSPPRTAAHPPDSLPSLLAAALPAPPRTSILDRCAMRVGLWLLIWSARPPRTADRGTGADAGERELLRQRAVDRRELRDADAAWATRLWMHGA